MTEDKELREAVQYLKDTLDNVCYVPTEEEKRIQTLLALAERYLAVGEMLPQKKYCGKCYPSCTECPYKHHCELREYNELLTACHLAYTKQMTERLEGLEEVIDEAWIYDDVWVIHSKDLATAIRNHIANVSKTIGEE